MSPQVVQQVQEYYADFLAINPDLASLGIPSIAGLTDGARWSQSTFDRTQQGVCSLLLALKKRPLIRYTAKSETVRHDTPSPRPRTPRATSPPAPR